jgi:hypothetical protein
MDQFGCEDVDYTPAYPLTIRLMATLYLTRSDRRGRRRPAAASEAV